jgi:MoaA/NifB/PqqE/SkfB family radical SAM enzyme
VTREAILAGIAAGAPARGPSTVHIDVTNACNAACITCWDHSPLLEQPRAAAWKQRMLACDDFMRLVDELAALGSVEAVILSGMGEPLVHPDIYRMIAAVKQQGWHLTILTNLVAADIDRLAASGVDQLLVGVHGARPASYLAFHPGWTERHFATLCRYLRRLKGAGVRTRHVQVIDRNTAPDVIDMVRFGARFGAERVNYKLASLAAGTERTAVDAAQRAWLLAEALPRARALAGELGVHTNLDLFERQLGAAAGGHTTTPIADVGCFMGYVYTRITVDRDVLYCCNTTVHVGSLASASFASLWYGEAWQGLRRRLRRGDYLAGCERCGKFEQNVKWSRRFREHAGEAAWEEAIGKGRAGRRERRLTVVA